MDSRKVSICYNLIKNQESKISAISKVYNKSSRTIRNDVETINGFLKKNKLEEIEIINNIVYLNCNPNKLKNLLDKLNYSEYYLDQIERRAVILIYALIKGEVFTIEELSDFMYVSRSTVVNDLISINDFIGSFNLEFESARYYGHYIKEYPDSKKFDLIEEIINYDLNIIVRFFNQSIKSELDIKDKYFSDVVELINNTEKESQSYLTDYSKRLFNYFLLVYLNVVKKDVKSVNTYSTNDFNKLIIRNINKYLGYDLSKQDVLNIKYFIDKLHFSSKSYKSKDKVKAQFITSQFIKQVSEKINIDFTGDSDLLKSLSDHLSDIIENPIIRSKEYSDVLKYAKENRDVKNSVEDSIDLLRIFIERNLTDVEVDFIIIYFLASLEKLKNSISKFKILLITSESIISSYYIKQKLVKVLPNSIVDILNFEDWDSENNYDYDLIISTTNKEENFADLTINPLLDLESTIKILEEVDNIKNKKISNQKNDVMDYRTFNHFDNKSSKEMNLLYFLNEETIRFGVEASDWKEAIRESAKILVENSFIEKDYVNAMIENVEKYGPYIILREGISIPHASSSFGVNNTCMSLVKLSNTVKIQGSDIDISYFICVASNNMDHFNSLNKLMNVLKDDEIHKLFMDANSKEDIVKVIKLIESI